MITCVRNKVQILLVALVTIQTKIILASLPSRSSIHSWVVCRFSFVNTLKQRSSAAASCKPVNLILSSILWMVSRLTEVSLQLQLCEDSPQKRRSYLHSTFSATGQFIALYMIKGKIKLEIWKNFTMQWKSKGKRWKTDNSLWCSSG